MAQSIKNVRNLIDEYAVVTAHDSSSDHMQYIESSGYYCISITQKQWLSQNFITRAEQWLEQHVARENWKRVGRYYWFTHERDAVFFSLVWL